ncbi:MAG: histidine phosphatase family protein [Alphaproteobacteria bacterium]
MIFLRHPRPQAPAGLCYGRMDIDIGPKGEADILRALRQTPKVTRVVASPALRCRKLAEALAARDDVALSFDPRLRELDFGAWEGVLWEDIPRWASDPWADDPWAVAPPGGEPFAKLHTRVAAAIREIGPGNSALVCHAGPIRAARMIFTGASFDEVFAEPVPYASGFVFMWEPS